MFLQTLTERKKAGKKMFALLIDPDKQSLNKLATLFGGLSNSITPDVVLVGGSLLFNNCDKTIETIKANCNASVFLFPGNASQISTKADGILLLSLISGRNAEFLIGQHVNAAPILAKSELEVLPVGYMLIGEENYSSVRYMSNTMPIPQSKTDIAIATALAGQMLGLKAIYLEAGSGAKTPVPTEMIKAVSENIDIPLIVGGGLRTIEDVETALNAGADMVVVGNSIEKNPQLAHSICSTIKNY